MLVPETRGYTLNNGNEDGGIEVDGDSGYWKRLETIEVGLITEKEGWFLQRTAEPVSRRYSDFVWLLDCLIKRYVSDIHCQDSVKQLNRYASLSDYCLRYRRSGWGVSSTRVSSKDSPDEGL